MVQCSAVGSGRLNIKWTNVNISGVNGLHNNGHRYIMWLRLLRVKNSSQLDDNERRESSGSLEILHFYFKQHFVNTSSYMFMKHICIYWLHGLVKILLSGVSSTMFCVRLLANDFQRSPVIKGECAVKKRGFKVMYRCGRKWSFAASLRITTQYHFTCESTAHKLYQYTKCRGSSL